MTTARVALLAVLLCLGAFIAPWLAPHSPTEIDVGRAFAPPSADYLLGTDNLGRDVLSRVLHAARTDVLLALAITVSPLVLGAVAGSLAGAAGERISAVMLRLVDGVIAIPFLVLVLAVLAVTGPGVGGLLVAVPAASWAIYARIAAAEASVVARSGVVQAQRGLAMPGLLILRRYVLPPALRPCVAYGTGDFATNLVLVASVSYLGIGVQPPSPEWGAMIAEAQPYLGRNWLPAVAAASAIVVVSLCVSLMGDRFAIRKGS